MTWLMCRERHIPSLWFWSLQSPSVSLLCRPRDFKTPCARGTAGGVVLAKGCIQWLCKTPRPLPARPAWLSTLSRQVRQQPQGVATSYSFRWTMGVGSGRWSGWLTWLAQTYRLALPTIRTGWPGQPDGPAATALVAIVRSREAGLTLSFPPSHPKATFICFPTSILSLA